MHMCQVAASLNGDMAETRGSTPYERQQQHGPVYQALNYALQGLPRLYITSTAMHSP
jgi:hypothetical protein